MEPVTHHSIARASEQAVLLWALASAQYPKGNAMLLDTTTATIIEVASVFALNARRVMEVLPKGKKFALSQPRWSWRPTVPEAVVADLWESFNRVIHAQKLQVGFEELPSSLAAIDGGALVVPYLKAETDRKALSFLDPFAMSHAFLYGVLPAIYQEPGAKRALQ